MRTYTFDETKTYVVVGDVHADYDQLHALLTRLGFPYDPHTGLFQPHPDIILVFIGDLVDRGPENFRVVETVRHLVELGAAHCVMGNHDLNAVHWPMPNPSQPGAFLRPHIEQNYRQHESVLDEAKHNPMAYASMLDWFKTLPIFVKIGPYNFIHACWQPSAIKKLIFEGAITEDGVLTEKGWMASGDKTHRLYDFFNTLLKGPDEELPDNLSFVDANGIVRTKSRKAWWEKNPPTYDKAYASLPPNAKFRLAAFDASQENSILDEISVLPPEERIFIGHYSMKDEPAPLSERVMCVDYIAHEGLMAYRIHAEHRDFDIKNFISARSTVNTPCPHPEPAF